MKETTTSKSGCLSISLALHDYTDLQNAISSSSFINDTLTDITPTTISSWNSVKVDDVEGTGPAGGVALGCEDGTVFIWRYSTPAGTIQKAPSSLSLTGRTSPSSTNALSRASFTTSRSASPGSHYASPFYVSQRSRIVSGITAERVEAPKNYVDFDDEPDKLKDILKGRNPRDKGVTSSEESKTASARPSIDISTAPKENKSLLSPTPRSPPHTPNLLPVSPTSHHQPARLRLLSHTLLPAAWPRSAVISTQTIGEDDLLAVLQRSGCLTILATEDGRCAATLDIDTTLLDPPEGVASKSKPNDAWNWERLTVHQLFERTVIIASASLDSNSISSQASDMQEDESQDLCRTVVVELTSNRVAGSLEVGLEAIGQWCFEGPPESIGLHVAPADTPNFFYIDTIGHLCAQCLSVLPYPVALGNPKPSEVDTPDSQRGGLSVNLPNPFKMTSTKPSEGSDTNEGRPGRVSLEPLQEIGLLPFDNQIMGCRMISIAGKLYGLAWSLQELVAFTYDGQAFHNRFKASFFDIQDVHILDDTKFIVVYEDKSEYYTVKTVDENNDEVQPSPNKRVNVQPHLLHSLSVGTAQAVEVVSSSSGVAATTKDGRLQLENLSWEDDKNRSSQVLWRAPTKLADTRLTAMLPIDLGSILLGYSDGHLRQTSLIQACRKRSAEAMFLKVSDHALDGFIVALQVLKNLRTNERLVVGGADDGSIAVWSLADLKLRARWTVFNTPLKKVLQFQDIKSGPLGGCVLCVAEDGTIAVVAIDGYEFLYIIPGSAFPLERVCIGQDNLLLIYSDHRARLWDIKTREFWRSMTSEKAEEMLTQGGWSQKSLKEVRLDAPLSAIATSDRGIDFASTLNLDIARFITDSTTIFKSISTSKAQTQNIFLARDRLRAVLSTLLTPGLNKDIDEICRAQLGIPISNVSTGFCSSHYSTIHQLQSPAHAWCISSNLSAARALCITATLRALSVFEGSFLTSAVDITLVSANILSELSQSASTVISFYTSSLAGVIGRAYKSPNLAFIARCWLDGSSEIRQAARMLFDAAAVGFSDEEVNSTVEAWQHQLPCLQPTIEKESTVAALALYLCGHLAAERYSLLSTNTLKDISKSVSLYLHDEHSIYRVLAVDLCSRGFHVWQHYIDALEILRALFSLAASTKKEAITAQNVGAQARVAILHISSTDTPLFMTTLSLDILNPTDTEHRKSVMQVVAFLIRKRPMVLYSNLPKLMEAVVKSLDPNSTTNRDAVHDTATEILGHVVKTFPNVDFQMSTQKLAVGSNEGAIVMYDLKTAIRLYVLEGHKKALTACSFSPDGRRLVTLSLEESVVLVWKVGSSFSSFFNPGAPPRQGHSGSDPFKTIPFNVGDEGKMDVSETLELVKFEWVADRSVKLKIRSSVLTFST